VSLLPEFNELTVAVRGLKLHYKTNITKKPNFKEALVHLGRGEKTAITVEALKGISFDVYRGTVLGVIGANGAGKSTLMKAIAGLLPPTEGEIELRGKVSAMLSLGVGFNPNLSGRENVLLGGLAAGLGRQEIEENFAKIVDFAELHDHIEMPMRTYSAGMYSRLGFAVATTINPEILLIDEALSTGDASFKEKSAQRIDDLAKQAKTLIVVSHALGTIQELCTDVVWLDHGNLIKTGKPDEIVAAYTKFLHVGNIASVMEDF
jgi:ABC-type polysaccharide/polyol phosphate transport system ATPase subunit